MKKCALFPMTQVWERLFIGSTKDAERLATSNPHRVTTVLSLCAEPVVKRARKVNYVHIPIPDATPISVGEFDAVIDGIAENIRWGTVLLHCGSGLNRSPIMAAAWMHVVGYKNIDAALEEIARMRPTIAPCNTLLASAKEHLR
jgi:protein-tyrosine phosphatase